MATMGQGSHSDSIFEQASAIASLTWVKNNHTYKFGGELRNQGDLAVSRSNLNGSYAFSNAQTALPYIVTTSASGTVGATGNTIGRAPWKTAMGVLCTGQLEGDAQTHAGYWAAIRLLDTF